MRDIQGLLIDIDGVLHVAMRPIPGAAAALRSLRAHNMPFRLLTNTTVFARASLAAALNARGFAARTAVEEHVARTDQPLCAD